MEVVRAMAPSAKCKSFHIYLHNRMDIEWTFTSNFPWRRRKILKLLSQRGFKMVQRPKKTRNIWLNALHYTGHDLLNYHFRKQINHWNSYTWSSKISATTKKKRKRPIFYNLRWIHCINWCGYNNFFNQIFFANICWKLREKCELDGHSPEL